MRSKVVLTLVFIFQRFFKKWRIYHQRLGLSLFVSHFVWFSMHWSLTRKRNLSRKIWMEVHTSVTPNSHKSAQCTEACMITTHKSIRNSANQMCHAFGRQSGGYDRTTKREVCQNGVDECSVHVRLCPWGITNIACVQHGVREVVHAGRVVGLGQEKRGQEKACEKAKATAKTQKSQKITNTKQEQTQTKPGNVSCTTLEHLYAWPKSASCDMCR